MLRAGFLSFHFGLLSCFVFLDSIIYSNFPAYTLKFPLTSFVFQFRLFTPVFGFPLSNFSLPVLCSSSDYLFQFSGFRCQISAYQFRFPVPIIYSSFRVSTLKFPLTIYQISLKNFTAPLSSVPFLLILSKFWRANPSCNTFLNLKFRQLFG